MLGERLLRALEEGQKAGGDSRGMQSAALLIVKDRAGYGGYNDRYCDLRVDDHEEPIAELRRIFDLWKVEALIRSGYELVEKGQFDEAFSAGNEAIRLAPESAEPYYHLACFLSRGGRSRDALSNLRQAIAKDPQIPARAREDPDFQPLAADPEFRELVGDPPEE
jgi:tetratricopeptide (TPR) repeat protein